MGKQTKKDKATKPKKSTKINWEQVAAVILKNELKQQKISYEELCKRLARLGIKGVTPASIANKISRGTFSFAFFIQCMKAIDSPRFYFNITASKENYKTQHSFLLGLLLEQIKSLDQHEIELLIALLTPQKEFQDLKKTNKMKENKRLKKETTNEKENQKKSLSSLLALLSSLKSTFPS